MKRAAIVLLLLAFALLMLTSCEKTTESKSSQIETIPNAISVPGDNPRETHNTLTNIIITVGDSAFTAKLYDNEAAKALLALLPMTLNMSDLHGNEKYYNLADNLPSESTEKPETMNAGDIMCWSSNCLVLFYETFPNSFGDYVRLGYIEDVSGLAAALGSGDVQVFFAIDN